MTLDSPDASRWGLHLLVRDGVRYLTLDSLTHYDGGRAQWKVIAATELPPFQAAEEFAWVDCAYDGKAEASIAAIGVWRGSTLTQIRYAVRPTILARRFELLDPQRVACAYDEDRR